MVYGQVKVSSGKVAVSSAVGIISFLEEQEKSLQIFALEKIYEILDLYWPEVAESLVEIEKLFEDETFSRRELAAIIASKIYFHLEEYNEALKYALGAGELFNIFEKSQFTHTILGKCIEEYIKRRNEIYEFEAKQESRGMMYGDESAMDLDVPPPIDPRLEKIVERMLWNCIKQGDEKQTIGIAFDSKRLSIVQNAFFNSKNHLQLAHYCIKNAQQLIPTKKFRNEVLDLVAKIHQKLGMQNNEIDDSMLCLCLYHQENIKGVAEILYKLLCKGDDESALACQIAFDLVDLENQSFLSALLQNPLLYTNRMKKLNLEGNLAEFDDDEDDMPISSTFIQSNSLNDVLNINSIRNGRCESSTSGSVIIDTAASSNTMKVGSNDAELKQEKGEDKDVKEGKESADLKEKKETKGFIKEEEEEMMEMDNSFPFKTDTRKRREPYEDDGAYEDFLGVKKEVCEEEQNNRVDRHPSTVILEEAQNDDKMDYKLRLLRHVLSGKASIELNLQFLHRSNHADLILLNDIKNAVDHRSGITHNGIVIAHAFMQAGTSCDVFLRNNLDWLAKAVNWAKFSATASLGVIHKGQTKDSRKVLSTYLPSEAGGISRSPYSEGGALYALGLIHANHMNKKIKDYLLSLLKSSSNDETVQHGACLGIGLLCLGTNDDRLYEDLKNVMYMDSAVVGEAAAYAIGLVMLASASQKAIDELLAYAHDTQHEKIIRACSVAMSMVMYRKEEEADALIDQLSLDKDALIRYGAMYTIAMAYCGTSKTSALKQLLHVSVSDVCDDVRRAAVVALGFVLCNSPEQVPKMLNLLSESYNAHVRYAAALAVGISCSGTGLMEAINLLIKMTSDSTDFVRQGAFIGLGLVLQQVTEGMNEKVKAVREMIIRVISDKHEDVMTRFGAILAAGLIDAGGRNATATFFSRTGHLRREAAVGFCLFSQLWYWYPLIHCISLAFLPSALIGVNKHLMIPVNFKVKCLASPELFAYPPPTPKEKKEEKKETVTAILSTAAKKQAMKASMKVVKEELATPNISHKPMENDGGDVEMKSVEKPMDSAETSSVASDGRSLSRLDVSSVVATVGDQLSSRVSHAESVFEGDSSNVNMSNTSNITSSDTSTQPIQSNNATNSTDIIDHERGMKKANGINAKIEAGKKINEKYHELRNPCRVLPQQEKYIEFYTTNCRYAPISSNRKSGFILLRDTRPSEREAVLMTEDNKIVIRLDHSNPKELDPPEAFEWSG